MAPQLTNWLWLTCATTSLLRAQAGSIDVILDDADDHIQYIQNNKWARGELCGRCPAKPDPSLAYEGTWTDTTHNPGDAEPRIVSTRFTGTAISVYCILGNNMQSMTNLSFVLDGAPVGTYLSIPPTSTEYQYHVRVYNKQALENKEHTLEIHVVGDTKPSLLLLDYLVYTKFVEDPDTMPPTPPPSTSSPSSSTRPTAHIPDSRETHPMGAIIGGVIGGFSLLALMIAFMMRRRRAQQKALVEPHRWMQEIFLRHSTAAAAIIPDKGAPRESYPETRDPSPPPPELRPRALSVQIQPIVRTPSQSSPPSPYPSGTISLLRTEVAVLREELMRVRQQQDEEWAVMEGQIDAPPQYEPRARY
ncbi:hypothetical protein C8Q76DRAFT_673488 [Earliella scabrosa]|nr:hypothetical protein C8Q76DRAFT_673488 [Earliella scabrosa]